MMTTLPSGVSVTDQPPTSFNNNPLLKGGGGGGGGASFLLLLFNLGFGKLASQEPDPLHFQFPLFFKLLCLLYRGLCISKAYKHFNPLSSRPARCLLNSASRATHLFPV